MPAETVAGVGVKVGVGDGVGVEVGVEVAVGVDVGVSVGVSVGVEVKVGVRVGLGVGVKVGNGEGVGVGVKVGTGSRVGVGVTGGRRERVGARTMPRYSVSPKSKDISNHVGTVVIFLPFMERHYSIRAYIIPHRRAQILRSDMHIDIVTLFPNMFVGPFEESIIRRAQEMGALSITIHDLRAYGLGRHRQVDDEPYGGAGGMLLRPEPIVRAVESILDRPVFRGAEGPTVDTSTLPPIILLTPQGRPLTQHVVKELAAHPRLVLICGRYEGVDERVRQYLVTDEISIGDYVLSGGELAAMVVVDAVARALPGVLGYARAAEEDSFAMGLLEGPQYTRPPEFRGRKVPEVLISGHHARIARWRRKEALRRTWLRRPDLLETAPLSDQDRALLQEIQAEERAKDATQDMNPHRGVTPFCTSADRWA